MRRRGRCNCALCESARFDRSRRNRARAYEPISALAAEAAAEREPMTCDGFGCAFCNDDEYDRDLLGHAPLTAPLVEIARAA